MPAPVNTTPPAIVGDGTDQGVLSATPGVWTGDRDYQWLADSVPIPGETGTSFTKSEAFVGKTITVRETVTNGAGAANAVSAGVGPLEYTVPVNSVPPTISGAPTFGEVLTVASVGVWSEAPTSYVYQWKRDGVAIGGATEADYELAAADVGANITCTVTASNGVGSASATSNALGPVAGVAPTILSATSLAVVENAAASLTLLADAPVTWTITGGADQAQFSIVGGNGLTLGAKNYEQPADADMDNAYVVQVTATHASGGTASATITFTVEDASVLVASSTNGPNTSHSNPTITWNQDVPQGANRVAVVFTCVAANDTISGATFAGEPMELGPEVLAQEGTSYLRLKTFLRWNPPVGPAKPIVVTRSTPGTNARWYGQSVVLADVEQNAAVFQTGVGFTQVAPDVTSYPLNNFITTPGDDYRILLFVADQHTTTTSPMTFNVTGADGNLLTSAGLGASQCSAVFQKEALNAGDYSFTLAPLANGSATTARRIGALAMAFKGLKHQAQEPIYYFSSSTGADSNTGLSESDPFKSLDAMEALSPLTAGARLKIKSGEIIRRATPRVGGPMLQLASQGTPTNPVVLETYGGAAPGAIGGDMAYASGWQAATAGETNATAVGLNAEKRDMSAMARYLSLSGVTGAFSAGQTITQATTGRTATVVSWQPGFGGVGTLHIAGASAPFSERLQISGTTGSGTVSSYAGPRAAFPCIDDKMHHPCAWSPSPQAAANGGFPTAIDAWDDSNEGSDSYYYPLPSDIQVGDTYNPAKKVRWTFSGGVYTVTVEHSAIAAHYGARSPVGAVISFREDGNSTKWSRISGYDPVASTITFENDENPHTAMFWAILGHPLDLVQAGQFAWSADDNTLFVIWRSGAVKSVAEHKYGALLSGPNWQVSGVEFRRTAAERGDTGSVHLLGLAGDGGVLANVGFRQAINPSRPNCLGAAGPSSNWTITNLSGDEAKTHSLTRLGSLYDSTIDGIRGRRLGRTIVYRAGDSHGADVFNVDACEHLATHGNGITDYQDTYDNKTEGAALMGTLTPVTAQTKTSTYANEPASKQVTRKRMIITQNRPITLTKPAVYDTDTAMARIDGGDTDGHWDRCVMVLGTTTGLGLFVQTGGATHDNHGTVVERCVLHSLGSQLEVGYSGLTNVTIRDVLIQNGGTAAFDEWEARGAIVDTASCVYDPTPWNGCLTNAMWEILTRNDARTGYESFVVGPASWNWTIPAYGAPFSLEDVGLSTTEVSAGYQPGKTVGHVYRTRPGSQLELPAGLGDNAMFDLDRGVVFFKQAPTAGTYDLVVRETNNAATSGTSRDTTIAVSVV